MSPLQDQCAVAEDGKSLKDAKDIEWNYSPSSTTPMVLLECQEGSRVSAKQDTGMSASAFLLATSPQRLQFRVEPHEIRTGRCSRASLSLVLMNSGSSRRSTVNLAPVQPESQRRNAPGLRMMKLLTFWSPVMMGRMMHMKLCQTMMDRHLLARWR